jgi:hypothetical protein
MERFRSIRLLAVSAAFTVIGLGMTLAGEGPSAAAGLAFAAFFGGCSIVFAIRMTPSASPRPDARGVTLIQPNRTRLAGLAAGAALLAIACPQIAAMARPSGDPVAQLMGPVGAAVLGFAAMAGLLRLSRPRALYRFDPVGIANLQGRGWFIPWRAIRGIDPFAVRGEYFLTLEVDPSLGPPDGIAARPGRIAGFPGVTIGPQGTAVRFDEFAELVTQYWNRARVMRAHN